MARPARCKTRTFKRSDDTQTVRPLKIGPECRRGRGHEAIMGVIPNASPAGTVFAELFARTVSITRSRWGYQMARKSSETTNKLNRRLLLKGAAAGGAVVATEAIGGFPTVWAQNTKDVTLVHAGGSYAAIKEIGEQATKDLGFKIVMQAITDDVQLNRSLTQPTTIDINNIDSTKTPYLVGKGVLAPIPVAKYKYWADTVPLFTKNSYPNGGETSNQGLSPAKALFYEDKDGKKLATKPTEFLTFIPTIYNADTLSIRPDLVR